MVGSLITSEMLSNLTKEQLQSWNNFIYALRNKDLEKYLDIVDNRTVVNAYRVKIVCAPEIESVLDLRKDFARDPLILKKAHPGAYASWRECVTTFSMQIALSYRDGCHMMDVDCDYGRPFYDVIGWTIHAAEFIYNKITGSVTNPFKVRLAWNKRGYGIPLVV